MWHACPGLTLPKPPVLGPVGAVAAQALEAQAALDVVQKVEGADFTRLEPKEADDQEPDGIPVVCVLFQAMLHEPLGQCHVLEVCIALLDVVDVDSSSSAADDHHDLRQVTTPRGNLKGSVVKMNERFSINLRWHLEF